VRAEGAVFSGMGGFEQLTGEMLMADLRDICDEATPAQFTARLTLSATVRAYIVKRFCERFPEDYACWARRGQPGARRAELAEGADRRHAACGEQASPSNQRSTVDQRQE
jgi:hypothetical protein